ncbi:MAG TPA: hypothetical protein VGZ51_09980 [Actinomycetota bacterium]|nr:hypothetical protein [Actinomycetota bacterium]
MIACRRATDVTTAAATEIGRVHLTAPREIVHAAEQAVNDRVDDVDHGIDQIVRGSVDGDVDEIDHVARESFSRSDDLVGAAGDVQDRTGCEC